MRESEYSLKYRPLPKLQIFIGWNTFGKRTSGRNGVGGKAVGANGSGCKNGGGNGDVRKPASKLQISKTVSEVTEEKLSGKDRRRLGEEGEVVRKYHLERMSKKIPGIKKMNLFASRK